MRRLPLVAILALAWLFTAPGTALADPPPATWTWTDDTRAPQTLAALDPGSSTDAGYRFTFSADEPATFDCELDGGGWLPCASGVSYGGLEYGAHMFAVRATDVAGNQEPDPATIAFVVPAPDGPQAPPVPDEEPAGVDRGRPGGAPTSPPPAGPPTSTPQPRLDSATLARMLARDGAALLRSSSRRALLRRPSINLYAAATARVSLTVVARRRGRAVVVARAQTSFRVAGVRSVRLRLTAAGRRMLAADGRLTLRVRATVAPALGASATAEASARV